ncbi:hypothetical protein [Sinomonas gamaensis]|uniref:hypothetical protein n=1 Tax=Sinomonas gamaensis TaxID=2565624 RepID=UPI0011086736|nr:hypothetical protein [Sinomonas gamaensis]
MSLANGGPPGSGGVPRGSAPWLRWAAVSMVAGGCAMFVLDVGGLFASAARVYFGLVNPAVGVVQILILFGCVGLWSDHALGGSLLARTGLALAILGLALLAVANLLSPFGELWVFDAGATVLVPLGFLLAGVAAIRHHVWHGWERCLPLVVGLLPVLVVFPTLALGNTSWTTSPWTQAGVGLWGLAFALLGWAEFREPPLEPVRVTERRRRRR